MKTKLVILLLMFNTLLVVSPNKGIEIPYINYEMKECKGMYSTKGKCNMCHSFGYVLNQGFQSKKFWRKKVIKMIEIFNAPIYGEKDIETVTNYLYENYGNGKLE